MFVIKQVGDKRLAGRISGSFDIDSPDAVVYGAFKNEDVLATAVFLKEGDQMVMEAVDTGKRLDVDLADGLARAAFHAARRTGTKRGRLGERLSKELKLALTKLGYSIDGDFALEAFFAVKNCGKK